MRAAGYRDRLDAGRRLASALEGVVDPEFVLALPRGGVPVAAEIARHAGAAVDLMLVRKLGVPGHRELAMGAIASGGIQVINSDVLDALGLAPEAVATVVAEEQAELERRARAYRGDRPAPVLAGRRVLLVDDGIATGATMLAAVEAARAGGAAEVAVAAPVGSPPAVDRLAATADAVVCPLVPERFVAVGWWYAHFDEVDDGSIRGILATFPP
ncbi:MAG: phosphoribosyltransferase [Actinobacteria bacterium]|nr:phosphoribosyltransferase [Actinomycetota bacterium]